MMQLKPLGGDIATTPPSVAKEREDSEAGRNGAPPSGGASAASHWAGSRVFRVPLVTALPPALPSPARSCTRKQALSNTCLDGWDPATPRWGLGHGKSWGPTERNQIGL